jgi:hypothetical protein
MLNHTHRLLGDLPFSGTTPAALNSGFLWVIKLGSTFFNPLVTPAPWLIEARKALGPGAGADLAVLPDDAGAAGAGAGGGGGGAGDPEEASSCLIERAS